MAEQPTWQLVWALRIAVVCVFCGLWQVGGTVSPDLRFVLATPAAVLGELVHLVRSEQLLRHMLYTGTAAGIGLFGGVAVGSAVGLGFWFSKTASAAARPLLLLAANAPVFALAPLLVIWFGVGLSLKIALAFYFTFFMSVASTHDGVSRGREDRLEEVYSVFGGSKWHVFRRVVVPGALDSVFGAMRRSVALALLGAFVGEFIASQMGLGYVILRAARLFNVAQALAGGVAFVALALLFDLSGRVIEKYRTGVVQMLSVPRAAWQRH